MTFRVVVAVALAAACSKADKSPAPLANEGTTKASPVVAAPYDIKSPPADATRRPSGLVYKTITAAPNAPAPKRNDTVMIKWTGWRQGTGETFFNNMKEDKPMPLSLAVAAKGFTEGLQLVRKGEKAMLWLPPEIGLKNQPAGKAGETLVYLVEVVDILEAPPVPPDLTTPPADAKITTKSGVKYISLRPGTGKEKARSFDEVTFNVTAWDSEGRMFDTTEMKKKPAAKVPVFRQPIPMEDILTTMVGGERVRFWVDGARMQTPASPQPNLPSGPLVYEVELLQIDKQSEPPPPPPDVAKPPAGARKTPKGVFYKILASGKPGPKPTLAQTVKVHYTGWTTDGRMFDSSALKNEPAAFKLTGVIAGWTDALQLMSVGDKYRMWIPEELAYKGQPTRPQGMLVFEIELLEVRDTTAPPTGHHGAPGAPGGRPPGGPPPGGPPPGGHDAHGHP